MSSLSLLREIFTTQELNPGLLHCRRRQWHSTPALLPGKSHGRRSLVGCSPWRRCESDTTEQLHFHFSLSCTGEGNGNPLQCSCLENPRDGGAWWAAVYGVAQSWTRLKRLSGSSSSCIAGRFFTNWATREANTHPTMLYFFIACCLLLISFNRQKFVCWFVYLYIPGILNCTLSETKNHSLSWGLDPLSVTTDRQESFFFFNFFFQRRVLLSEWINSWGGKGPTFKWTPMFRGLS